MYLNFYIILASLSLGLIAAASKGAINIPTKPRDGQGSGYDMEDDEDDSDAERSGDGGKESECVKVRNSIKSSGMTGAYEPQCTSEGEFNPKQCTKTQCFCVNIWGEEVSGTRLSLPEQPNCSTIGRRKFLGAVTPKGVPPAVFPTAVTSARTVRKEESTAVAKPKQEPLPKVEDRGSGQGTGPQGRKSTSPSGDSWIKSRPTLLAGIIGGTAVGLLCAMLLLLFIIYRLRKKDEGSYALDEPKNSPAVAYTKANDREFFA